MTDTSVVRISILNTTETCLNRWLWFLAALAIASLVFCAGIFDFKKLKMNTSMEDRVSEGNNGKSPGVVRICFKRGRKRRGSLLRWNLTRFQILGNRDSGV